LNGPERLNGLNGYLLTSEAKAGKPIFGDENAETAETRFQVQGSHDQRGFKSSRLPDGKSSNRWKPKLPRSAVVAVVFLAKLDVNRKVGKL
jgi:hypothetical protein